MGTGRVRRQPSLLRRHRHSGARDRARPASAPRRVSWRRRKWPSASPLPPAAATMDISAYPCSCPPISNCCSKCSRPPSIRRPRWIRSCCASSRTIAPPNWASPGAPDFLRFVSLCFRQKRKTLRNNLAAHYGAAVDNWPEVNLRAEQIGISNVCRHVPPSCNITPEVMYETEMYFPIAALGCMPGGNGAAFRTGFRAKPGGSARSQSPDGCPRADQGRPRSRPRQGRRSWPRIFQKGNATSHYIGMTSESGPSEAWFLEPYESFGAHGEGSARKIEQSPLAADLEVGQRHGWRTAYRIAHLLAIFRGDLSYHPAEAISSLPKCRHMGVTLLRIKYGHDADLVQAARAADRWRREIRLGPAHSYLSGDLGRPIRNLPAFSRPWILWHEWMQPRHARAPRGRPWETATVSISTRSPPMSCSRARACCSPSIRENELRLSGVRRRKSGILESQAESPVEAQTQTVGRGGPFCPQLSLSRLRRATLRQGRLAIGLAGCQPAPQETP
jgi:hypothetical protein